MYNKALCMLLMNDSIILITASVCEWGGGDGVGGGGGVCKCTCKSKQTIKNNQTKKQKHDCSICDGTHMIYCLSE